jgi:hypothetical protein
LSEINKERLGFHNFSRLPTCALTILAANARS